MSKKRLLIVDRDGTILLEPEPDKQVDAFDKFDFYPGAISGLSRIASRLDFKWILLSNQDGLGTDSFPEDDFWPWQNKMISTLKGEGVVFEEVLIDRSFPHENLPTRKPGTKLLEPFLNDDYDLANSVVIGDRITDVQLAEKIGAKSILLADRVEDGSPKPSLLTKDWSEVVTWLLSENRRVSVSRKTKETDIQIDLSLDGSGKAEVSTGLNFFDHMLDQIARHSGCDLRIRVKGDLEVDEHHTIEDTGLALGEAYKKALGDKVGISRYGFLLPMDDSEARLGLDFGGRPWLRWNVEFKRDMVGDFPTEMASHFFKSFGDAAAANISVSVEGENDHHKIESIFKAFAKSLGQAATLDPSSDSLPSTKGSL